MVEPEIGVRGPAKDEAALGQRESARRKPREDGEVTGRVGGHGAGGIDD